MVQCHRIIRLPVNAKKDEKENKLIKIKVSLAMTEILFIGQCISLEIHNIKRAWH